MKCYYEELAVSRDASESEIKSAYRKLALKWHPDKNRDCTEEAKERFQLIQQAYEVLSDSQERAWYDNHREQILRGKNSNYEDVCLDVFQYFTVSCFKGYGDDAKGFYAIYREVFKKIAAEDSEFMDYEEELLNIPEFGDSKSSYEDVVGPFYAHWSAYCTKRTYAWLCPYNIKDIKDRKILREIEKDMKKVVQKAKKERNEEVRNLVSFVRKRDKRVQAYKKLLEERSVLNRQKQEFNRLEQIKRRQKELEEMRQNSQTTNSNDDYENKLKELEQQYSSEEDRSESEDESDEQNNVNHRTCNDELYCVGCNKQFKTERSFANHEMSKKHRDNIEKLKIAMKNEESLFQNNENFDETDEVELAKDIEYKLNTSESNDSQGVTTKNKARKTRHKKEFGGNISEENLEQVAEAIDILNNGEKDDWDVTNGKLTRKCKIRNKICKNKSTISQQQPTKSKSRSEYVSKIANESINTSESEIIQHICATCESKFQSKNKLFAHLKLTNHGVFIPKTDVANVGSTKCKKHKGKVNK